MDIDEITQAIYDMVHRYMDPVSKKRGVPAMAARIGMNVGTLQHEINRNIEDRRPDAIKLVAMMLTADDYTPLDIMARQCGRATIALPEMTGVSDRDLVEILIKVGKEVGEVFGVVDEARADNRITVKEAARITREITEALTALLELDTRTKRIAHSATRLHAVTGKPA